MQIAIDGPVAAGKGTVAKLVAERLGFLYVDTGALYRAISLYCDWKGVSKADEAAVCKLITAAPPGITLRNPAEAEKDSRRCTITLEGEDVSWAIRTEESSRGSSLVSRYLCVRDLLLDLQRDVAKKESVVMEGRDIGTFVLPGAELKIFLTGSGEVRTRRRHLELLARGVDVSYEQVMADLRERDRQDTTRQLRPLAKASDAVEVDTSALSIEEVVRLIISLAHETSPISVSAR